MGGLEKGNKIGVVLGLIVEEEKICFLRGGYGYFWNIFFIEISVVFMFNCGYIYFFFNR